MQASSRRIAVLRLAALAGAGCGVAVGTARAAGLDAADARAIDRTVRDQLAAFAEDDGPRAYAHAAPAIRAQFRDAATFLAMVKSGYAAIVRPRSVVFFQPEAADDGEAELRVQVVDRDGAAWLAVYRLERQSGGGWKIAGCALAPSRGRIA